MLEPWTAELSRAVNTYGVLRKVCSGLATFPAVQWLSISSAVENENHCDFKKLRSLLIRTHMLDLISTTEDSHYENYRQQQMETRKFGEPKVKKLDNPKFKEEEEQLRKRFTEQVKAEESRFRQWEQHVREASFSC
jgi:septin family protein